MRHTLSVIALSAALIASPVAGHDRSNERAAAGPALWVVPAMRSWQLRAGTWTLGARARIVLPAKAPHELRQTAETLASDLATVSGIRPRIATGSAVPGDIRLLIGPTHAGSASPEAYDLDVAAVATIRGATGDGVFAGTQSLLQLLEHDPRAHSIPRGMGSDWPAYRWRMMMIDAGRKYYAPRSLEAEMRKMAWLKMNTLHLHFTDWPAFRLNSPRFPGLAPKESYDRADIARLEATAHRYHITIIPEIDLPAHASALIRYRPSLAFDCPALRQSPWLKGAAGADAKNLAWVVDFTKPDNRRFVKQLLDEFIPWFDGPYFHLGGDEYNYDADKTRCPELMAYAKAKGFAYPGDAFVDWINQADRIVRSHGKTSVIWSWWRFRDDKTSIEPNRDIVIDTWNMPRLKAILADGYKVFVSPEDELYVSPGLAKGPGSYGTIDTAREYGELDLVRGPQVLGYGVSLWADGAEQRSDAAMLGQAAEPMAVLAERLWSGRGSATIDAFRARLNDVGAPPRSPAAN